MYIYTVYIYTYILLICFLNTGKTISEDQMGSLTWLVYKYLKFIFVFLSWVRLWRDGECMEWAAPYHSLIFFISTS